MGNRWWWGGGGWGPFLFSPMGASRREERGGFDVFPPFFYLSPKSGTDFIGSIDVEFVVLQ